MHSRNSNPRMRCIDRTPSIELKVEIAIMYATSAIAEVISRDRKAFSMSSTTMSANSTSPGIPTLISNCASEFSITTLV